MKHIPIVIVLLEWVILILLPTKEILAEGITVPDSLKIQTLKSKEYFASTNLSSSKNWKTNNNISILFFGSINTFNKKKIKMFIRIFELRCEIGYNRWIDSIWVKSTDNFFISSIWTGESHHRLTKSLLTNMKSQITDSWDYEIINSKPQRKWVSGPFTPGTIQFGAGLLFTIDKKSYINFSLFTLKLNTLKRNIKKSDVQKILAKTNKILLDYEYGFNIQSLIEIPLSKKINFENKSELFASNIQKNKIRFDVQNILGVKPLKLLKVQIMSKIAFDSLISEKLQLKHEMLFGISFN